MLSLKTSQEDFRDGGFVRFFFFLNYGDFCKNLLLKAKGEKRKEEKVACLGRIHFWCKCRSEGREYQSNRSHFNLSF